MRENQSMDSIIKGMIIGAIPERKKELEDIWNRYSPSIHVASDKSGSFFCEGGAFGIIQFTARSMEVLWILGFASWKAFHSYSAFLNLGLYDPKFIKDMPDQEQSESEYQSAVDCAQELLKIENINDFVWPNNIPHPRNGRPVGNIEDEAVHDLICMAGAFLFLHEIKHVIVSQYHEKIERIEEERMCDTYAVDMLIEEVAIYSLKTGYEESALRTKRGMSICLAFFMMLVLTPFDKWNATVGHPSTPERISSVIERVSNNENDTIWIYLSCAILSQMNYCDTLPKAVSFSSHKEFCARLIKNMLA